MATVLFAKSSIKNVLFQAHRGMVIGAHYIKRDLEDLDILNKAFGLYPHYKLAITGNSMPVKLWIS